MEKINKLLKFFLINRILSSKKKKRDLAGLKSAIFH